MNRQAIARRGKHPKYFTIAWNSLEGLVAVVAGVFSGSIALVGFGIDSFIEATSAVVLLWRMTVDADVQTQRASHLRSICDPAFFRERHCPVL
jgi:divalent metal cation (Fe/Co/Zn/Cd) transporter